MRWQRTLQSIDVHCEGEVGRIISAGLLNLPGNTIAAKLQYLNSEDQQAQNLRHMLTSEPRCNAAGSVVLLPPACDPAADTGFIVLQPDQAHAMSGSNAICAVTAILECGTLPISDDHPEDTKITLDTAAGLVTATADCRGGRVNNVSLDMPPAYCVGLDKPFQHPEYGMFLADIAFGGVFYAIIDPAQFGQDINPGNARDLATLGVSLHPMIDRQIDLQHPDHPEIHGLAYVMFASKENDHHRTCTTMRPGRLDRSPCGTGSNALIACLARRKEIAAGQIYRTQSVIGSQFQLQCRSIAHLDGRLVCYNTVQGRGFVYGISQIGVDPHDPFPNGYRLSDIWGDI